MKVQTLIHEFHFDFVRSSGPGGQNVNKVSTKAVLHWNPLQSRLKSQIAKRILQLFPRRISSEGLLVISSDRFRSRERNCEDCLQKLQQMLDQASAVPKKRIPTKTTRAAKERRMKAKLLRSRVKLQRQKSKKSGTEDE